MATPSIGANMKLAGEREFKQALSEINAGLKVNQSELALTSAEYANNSKSVEALTEKGKALQNQIVTQTDKVKKLEEALQASAEKHGESDKKTMKWQVSLNNAKKDLAKMNNELELNQKELKNSGRETNALSDIVGNLGKTMGISVPPQMQSMVTGLEKVNVSGALLVGVLAGIVVGLSKLTIETAKTADDLLTLSSITGITTDELQKMHYAAGLLDVSVETISGTMTKLTKNMDLAKKGSKEQVDAFKRLRVTYKDMYGQLKDNNEVFYETIDALGKVRNETQRDAYAMTIFGKSAKELNPLIEAGSEKLRELGIEAESVGYIMSGETLQKFGALDDAMERMSKQADAFKNSFATAMLPILTKLFETLGKIPVPVLQTVVVLATVITTVILLAKTFKSASDGVSGLMKMFNEMNPATLKTTAIIMGVVSAVVILAIAIAAILGKSQDLKNSMTAVGQTFDGMQKQVTSTQNANQRVSPYAMGGTHTGGYARVNDRQNDPDSGEIIDLPNGSRIYPAGKYPQGGGDTINISVNMKDVNELNDFINMAKNAKQQRRAK